MMRRSTLLITVISVGVAMLPVRDAAATTVQSPYEVSGALTIVEDVLGSSELWAYKEFGKNEPKLVRYEPNGAAWTLDDLGSYVHDLEMVSATDGWALTYRDGNDYLWHWGGEAWSRHSLPYDIWPDTIAAAAPNDLWISGRIGVGDDYWVWRWDGHTWQRWGFGNAEIDDVAVVGPDDVWVAQQVYAGDAQVRLSHWDGHTWTQRTVPDMAFLSDLDAAPGNVWVTGQRANASGQFMRWDTAGWTELPYGGEWIKPAPDGTLWSGSPYGDSIAHLVDGSWTDYDLLAVCSPNREPEIYDFTVRSDGGLFIGGHCRGRYSSSTLALLFDGESFTRI